MNGRTRKELEQEYRTARDLIYSSQELTWEKKLLRLSRLFNAHNQKLVELEKLEDESKGAA